MPADVNYADELHTGLHTFTRTPTVPDSSWGDQQMNSASPVTVQKLKHKYQQVYGQPHGTAAITERKVIHLAEVAGEVSAIECGPVVAAVGAATVTVDLRKNGTTILSGVITINNTHVAYQEVAGAITTPTYAAGDVFELVLVATAGGGTLPQGVYVRVAFRNEAG